MSRTCTDDMGVLSCGFGFGLYVDIYIHVYTLVRDIWTCLVYQRVSIFLLLHTVAQQNPRPSLSTGSGGCYPPEVSRRCRSNMARRLG